MLHGIISTKSFAEEFKERRGCVYTRFEVRQFAYNHNFDMLPQQPNIVMDGSTDIKPIYLMIISWKLP